MTGTLQPLAQNFQIVDERGFPTLYFIKWAQQRQIDITDGITAATAQALIDSWAASRNINTTAPISGGGNLGGNLTISHNDSAVTPGTYGSSTKSAVISVDQKGHVTGVTEATISGSGGGGGYPFNPPAASSVTVMSTNSQNPTVTDDASGLILNLGVMVSGHAKLALVDIPDPTTNWMCEIEVDPTYYNMDIRAGVCMYEASSGKTLTFGWEGSNSQDTIRAWYGTYTTSSANLGSNYASIDYNAAQAGVRAFRLIYDATADIYRFQLSAGGGFFTPLGTYTTLNKSRGSTFTTRANKVGLWARCGATPATGWEAGMVIRSLQFL